MEPTAFVSAFSGSYVTARRHAPSLTPTNRATSKRTPCAVLSSRSSISTYNTPQTVQKYVVKVIQKDRCTVVEVERDSNLRKALLAAKVDLYTLGGKLRNCGGAGQCGTCLVQVEQGELNMSGRTTKEEILLENKPDTWRLACRAVVQGDITVRTKPRM